MNPADTPAPSGQSRRHFITCAALSMAAAALVRGQTTPVAATAAVPAPAKNPEVEKAIQSEQIKEMNGRAKVLVGCLKPLVEKYGPEVIAIETATTANGAQARFEKMKLEKRDLTAVRELLWDKLTDPTKYQTEVLEQTDETLKCKVTKCFLAEAFRAAKSPEIGYALNCAWDPGFCKGLNPNIKFTRTKTLMQGDEYCNHSYELKKV